MTRQRAFWLSLAGSGLIVIGSLGPWAHTTVFDLSVSGIEGGGDGWITLVAGVTGAGVLLIIEKAGIKGESALVVPALFGLVALGVIAYDATNIFGTQSGGADDFLGRVDLIKPGWGLYAVGLGGLALAVGSGLMARRSAAAGSGASAPS